ncbi:hypothetical protein [Sporosarcina koreensis]|uniref:Uncharacterized protein n=1 Tax=Sporosarcina koreensis TaxID=334735 RepID=A0ABW0TVS8_9BACL
MRPKKKMVFLVTLALVLSLLGYFGSINAVGESTTVNIEVIKKDKSSQEQWIVLSNDRKIYIEEFSIWALIEENEKYTIVYDQMKKTGRYKLRIIVPGDYQGQF